MKWQIGSRDIVIRNTAVKRQNSTIATASIRFATDSETGCTLTDVSAYGSPVVATGKPRMRMSWSVPFSVAAEVMPAV